MRRVSRRQFVGTSAVAGAGFWVTGRQVGFGQEKSPNAKLNCAVIGAGGQGGSSINGVSKSENLVALCDVDKNRLNQAGSKFPDVKKYQDFRKMLEEMDKQIDAVCVATPDHMHAQAAAAAIRLGKHVYVEKPLTHNVHEARFLRRLAAEKKVATQMGNQGTSSGGLRRSVELVQAGGIGTIKEIHIWTNRPVWPQAPDLKERPKTDPVPESLDWDLWLGPAPERPYSKRYCPFAWRGWWDFGTGALGDMACHTANMAYWAARLTAPTTVEAEAGDVNPETYPSWARIRYEFPANGDRPPVTVWWYEGKRPNPETGKRDVKVLPPVELFHGEKITDSGSMIVGSKGILYSAGDYGGDRKLLPAKDFEGFQAPPKSIPDSPGHHAEWIRAAKGGDKAYSNFDYAGPLTEFILLGNVAIKAGKKIEWDAENLKVKNCPEADPWIKRERRKGWEL
jgi:predicted dehydrogenase